MALHSRSKRIAEEIRSALAMILMTELKDPRLKHGLITVSHVDVTSDLQHAHAWISVLGTEEETEAAMQALNHSRGYIKRMLGERIVIKYLPDLEFRLDTTGRYAAHINTLLKQIEKQSPQRATPEEGEDQPE